MTDSPEGSLLLFDRERSGLFFAAAIGKAAAELKEKWGEFSNQRVPLQGSKAGQAFTTGELIVQQHLQNDDEHFKGVDEQTQKLSQSMICAPLKVGGESIGVIQVLNKRPGPYTPRDSTLVEYFAAQAAAAIQNPRRIRELAAHMGLYAREGIDDLLKALNQPARREQMTLLFADMRGFTRLCQSQEDPTRTQEIVNDLLTMLAEQVITRGGVVNKFLGDAVFAFFRQAKGAEQAVRCAFGMLERFESLRKRWSENDIRDLRYLDLGVGIATDWVAVGTFGSATVRDFTAIGTAVNLAAAFERAARNERRVLVDQKTWSAVQEIVADADKPIQFKLRKPGQPAGSSTYPQYHLKRLRPDFAIRVFVSHSHLDRVFVEQAITEKLKKRGIDTWYSNADIVPGENYIAAIENGLLHSDWVVVVVSENAAKSDWVRAEVRTALKDQRLAQRILPVTVDDTKAASISGELAALHTLDARSAGDLGESLYSELARRTSQPEPDPAGTTDHSAHESPGRKL